MKNPDPKTGAKLKSKTHLQKTFFLFLSPVFARLALTFEKVLIWPNQKRYQKPQNFTMISNPWKKVKNL
jgi:hypothetical protein